MHHTAYTFDSLDDLLERHEQLERKGIEPKVPIQHGVTTSLYYQDPDGNFVELQIDNFSTPDDATAYMRGPEYSANPVGVSFDPALMRQARRQGTPVAELITQSWARVGLAPNCPTRCAALDRRLILSAPPLPRRIGAHMRICQPGRPPRPRHARPVRSMSKRPVRERFSADPQAIFRRWAEFTLLGVRRRCVRGRPDRPRKP